MKLVIVLIVFISLLNKVKGAEVKWEFYFESNQHELNILEQNRLKKLIIIMSKLNVDSVQIIGFADEDGGDKSNLILSKKRTYTLMKNLSLNDSIFVKSHWVGENFNHYIKDSTLKYKNRKVEVVIWHSGKKYPAVYFNGVRLKKGDNLDLPAVRFVPGKSILLSGGEQKLGEILEVLIKNPTVKFLIEGHVCCRHDVELSHNRAKAIYSYLTQNGIAEERLKYFGFGLSKPKYSVNDARNRRVELKVLDV